MKWRILLSTVVSPVTRGQGIQSASQMAAIANCWTQSWIFSSDLFYLRLYSNWLVNIFNSMVRPRFTNPHQVQYLGSPYTPSPKKKGRQEGWKRKGGKEGGKKDGRGEGGGGEEGKGEGRKDGWKWGGKERQMEGRKEGREETGKSHSA